MYIIERRLRYYSARVCIILPKYGQQGTIIIANTLLCSNYYLRSWENRRWRYCKTLYPDTLTWEKNADISNYFITIWSAQYLGSSSLFLLTRNISPTMTELNFDTFWHFSPTPDAKIPISSMRAAPQCLGTSLIRFIMIPNKIQMCF